MDTRIVITRVQRQKRKFVTVIAGLETVPDLRVKDAAKIFGKKFSSGASVNEAANGSKEVVIQGDMTLQIPEVLISEFHISPSTIYFLENGAIRPY
jgi:density-regulated protein